MLTVTDSKDGNVYEVVGFRQVTKGIYYLSNDGAVLLCNSDDPTGNLRHILKPLKWRAKTFGVYYTIATRSRNDNDKNELVVEECSERFEVFDNTSYDSGNYYRTNSEAQGVADKINNIFKEG